MRILCADQVEAGEGNIESIVMRDAKSTAESENLSMRGNSNRENIESPSSSQRTFFELWERLEHASGGNTSMNDGGQSDSSIVPTTTANNDRTERSAESDEGRELAKRNTDQDTSHRTQNRNNVGLSGLMGVREAARRDKNLRFTSLLHHITPQLLIACFDNLKRDAAPGIDNVTWHEYDADVVARIADLHGRVHRGAYRALPSRRTWIDKPDGSKRPLGIAALEDKIVQTAVLWTIQCIYEADFCDLSYGFRPGRSCHQALDALTVALTTRKVSWLLDADLSKFFDTLDHEWLCKFLEHRIGDKRILRLIRKWLHAGVVDDGQWAATDVGSPQGSVISPILANVFLHYVFDLWIKSWRKQPGRGDVIVVRYADDFVVGFQYQRDARDFQRDLESRFAKFGLQVNADKTRLIEFGRFAKSNLAAKGEGKPETFDFLGFTHISGVSRQGKFIVKRKSISKRVTRKLHALADELRKRRHDPIGEVGRWLGRVARGWLGYHAVPGNMASLEKFLDAIRLLWLKQLRRRSQRNSWNWKRFTEMSRKYLPAATILHPYPIDRHHARLKARAV